MIEVHGQASQERVSTNGPHEITIRDHCAGTGRVVRGFPGQTHQVLTAFIMEWISNKRDEDLAPVARPQRHRRLPHAGTGAGINDNSTTRESIRRSRYRKIGREMYMDMYLI